MKLIWVIIGGLVVYAAIFIILSQMMEYRRRVERRLDKIIRSDYTAQYSEVSGSMMKRISSMILQKLAKTVGRVIPLTPASRTGIQNTLKKARIKMSVSEYLTAMLLIAGISFILVFVLMSGPARLVLSIIGAVLGAELFRFYVLRLGKKNVKEMVKSFPDILDLMSISISAGSSFEQAIQNVIANAEGPLVDELAAAVFEMSMGSSRRVALKNMAERIEINSFTMFVTAVNQAEDLGMSMSQIMKTQAEASRDETIQNVRTEAMKLPIKILFPMLLFIFPAIFIVLLGPAVMNIITALQ